MYLDTISVGSTGGESIPEDVTIIIAEFAQIDWDRILVYNNPCLQLLNVKMSL